jgi:hypothetical protein
MAHSDAANAALPGLSLMTAILPRPEPRPSPHHSVAKLVGCRIVGPWSHREPGPEIAIPAGVGAGEASLRRRPGLRGY